MCHPTTSMNKRQKISAFITRNANCECVQCNHQYLPHQSSHPGNSSQIENTKYKSYFSVTWANYDTSKDVSK